MEVYKSKYLHLAFFAEQELIEMTWLPSTDTMTEEEYKQECLNLLEIIFKFSPKRIIPDSKNMFFLVTIELQEWTNEQLFAPALKMGLNKVAVVANAEMIQQLSIEQLMEEPTATNFITRYFDSKEKAKTWILSV